MNSESESEPIASEVAPTVERPAPKNWVDLLLRRPDALLERATSSSDRRVLVDLALIVLAGNLLYGIVVGSFSGGVQWWAAPTKILLGTSLCAAACFPSLYIFVSLSGADARPTEVGALLLGVLASTAILLAGFAPVAWVFSQSSTLVSFVGALHLFVWLVSILASQRVVGAALRRWKVRSSGFTSFWALVLVVTSLQMSTTLRPIVGSAPRLFDRERVFFLQHWTRTIASDAEAASSADESHY